MRILYIIGLLFVDIFSLYAAETSLVNRALINRLASIGGTVAVKLLAPLTHQTKKINVELLTPLHAEDQTKQILLPVGTRLLGTQMSYHPQNGHALIVCTHAVLPNQTMAPITAYLSSDASTVGVLVSKTMQQHYVVPQDTTLHAVFDSNMLLNSTPADGAP